MICGSTYDPLGCALLCLGSIISPQVIDFGKQSVITKDTVQIDIDALVYFRITDARAAVYRVQNLPDAVEFLTQATLRDIVAQMTLDDTFSSREQINAILLSKVQRDAERWGVTITRVEVFSITPNREFPCVRCTKLSAPNPARIYRVCAHCHGKADPG